MPSNHHILCYPLLLLPSIFPSIRVFSSELALCMRWPENWSFSFSNNPSNQYSELISLGLTGLIISLLSKNHSSKASILQHFPSLEKGMATYSRILAWKIPWTEKPGGLQSMDSQRVGDSLSSLHFAYRLLQNTE